LEEENNNHKFKSIIRVFQALRIAVNDEMGNLRNLLEKIPLVLAKDGMAMFVTFHSLEHKLVSSSIKEMVILFY
jgi:16S rRNA (cytosine1402-N4)-methyltransferase